MARLEQAKGAQTDESRSFAVACNRRSLRHLGCDASCRLASSSRSMPEHRSHAHLLGVRWTRIDGFRPEHVSLSNLRWVKT